MVNLKLRYLLFANYLNLFAFAFFTPLYAIFVLGLGGNAKTVGLTAGLGAYAAALMILFFGKWENSQKHKEKLVVAGFFWLAAGAVAYMFVHQIWQLFAVQVFNAIGTGLLTPALRSTYATWEDKGKETQEWAFWEGGNRIFTATGAVVSGFILSSTGNFRGLFALMATVQLVAALVSLKILNK
ncbi:MAG TPA: MFS transporter [Candidatus Binatia bacterium]|nr:MFS transporter [Candidatus Binatia bacterium]